jgi:serine O-acetyltransferase
MFILRKSANSRKHSLKWYLYRILLRHYSYKYGYQIPYNTKIGPGFFIGHFGTLVISDKASFGKNCNIAHCVTVGKASRGKLKGSPTIGDFVWIGTGSIIVGNIIIGNNVLIAPGAYVNFDVPDHSIVIGNPGKIINRQNPTDGYINNYIR